MRFPTMLYVRLAKAQTTLRIPASWSEPLQVAWIFYEYSATGWTAFGASKLKKRLNMLVQVYTCQNAKLLEITCHSSYTVFCQNLLLLLFCTFVGSLIIYHMLYKAIYSWAMTCDFQQCGTLSDVVSFKPVQPPFKLRISKLCLVSCLTLI